MMGLRFGLTGGEWKPLTIEMHRIIRHHPEVAAYLLKKADECQAMTTDNFETGLQNRKGTTRARAWVRPANAKGIEEELADGVLSKAAAAMRGR